MGLSSGSGRAPRGLSGGGKRQTKAWLEPRNARPERSGGWQGDGYFASRCKARTQSRAAENSRLRHCRPGLADARSPS
ncbi:hypothetical protein [Gluconobacter sp. Gdi]|uniref:hypothetical protein n=1 Tax=Gluconobacter sp. Gdi TaxID=2691888 RepID=UPI0007838475|nr:hypothetical protein [Gluconobacter sp. Gdi]KXV66950.1 hypothetical protein AD950_00615 [Gluconobacter oxydans]